jgi:hypothetical protein
MKLGWPRSLTTHFESELRANFSEAWITDYEPLIPLMTNDDKDRHVTAAAVRVEALLIVTFNLRHFRPEHLDRWNIRAIHPQVFLSGIFHEDPALVLTN